ncbi:MAG: alpha/beta fold hydrolase [Actinomycetota bacterium]|nr:MAG: alpha/beta fold hydrolase [Actinomycetota bacterium]
MIVPIATLHRVLALDLPGFGASDKPLGTSYVFVFFERAIKGFLDALEVDRVGGAGHDLGGPIAVHWAFRHSTRLIRMALLNTLLFPQFSDAVVEFVRTAMTPGLRERLTSWEGLE